MLHDENLRPEPRRDDFYFLWRMMIDRRFQGRGLGRLALDRLVDHVRTRPRARVLLTSCMSGPGSALGFYERRGFARTGGSHDGEVELALPL